MSTVTWTSSTTLGATLSSAIDATTVVTVGINATGLGAGIVGFYVSPDNANWYPYLMTAVGINGEESATAGLTGPSAWESTIDGWAYFQIQYTTLIVDLNPISPGQAVVTLLVNGVNPNPPPSFTNVVFTTSGTVTTPNDGITHTYRMEIVGGGGGGGGGGGNQIGSLVGGAGGGGGGNGSAAIGYFSIGPNLTIQATVGIGGTGGAPGGSGGGGGAAGNFGLLSQASWPGGGIDARGGSGGGGGTGSAAGSPAGGAGGTTISGQGGTGGTGGIINGSAGTANGWAGSGGGGAGGGAVGGGTASGGGAAGIPGDAAPGGVAGAGPAGGASAIFAGSGGGGGGGAPTMAAGPGGPGGAGAPGYVSIEQVI